MEAILAVHEMLAHDLHEFVTPIAESELNARPAPGINTPAWVLGHLSLSFHLAGTRLELPWGLPEDWKGRYGPGSTGEDTGTFSKSHLLQTFDASRLRLIEAFKAAPVSLLDSPHPVEFFVSTPLNTIGKSVAAILTGHMAVHLGQITVWRRLKGFQVLY